MADEPEDAPQSEDASQSEDAQQPDELPRLDWSSAEVSDGTLTVKLSSEPSDPWRGVFERTVRLLRGGGWGEPELESGQVRVTDVHEGVEESLRQFLEGAVQEANATLARNREPDAEADEKEHERGEDEAQDERDDDDSRMTERFRDFGS